MNPTFALLVPCKNGAAFLPRLMASAQAQTRPFDEIWIFDDGSHDGSDRVARELGAQVLRSPQSLGPAAARNRLTEACHCEWLHFHDVDDLMDPHYLERAAARTRPEVDVVVCDMLWIEEETGQTDNHWTYDEAALNLNPTAYLLVNTIGGINGLYRRRVLTSIDGFTENLRFWEDLDLNLRLSQRGARFSVINEDLVTAYRRRESYSNSNLAEVWRVKLQIMERLLTGANADLLKTLADEAEAIATRFAALGLWREIPAALTLARKAGANPPSTRHPLLQLIKPWLPTTWTFRLQYLIRKS